jgi:hypothetical protein
MSHEHTINIFFNLSAIVEKNAAESLKAQSMGDVILSMQIVISTAGSNLWCKARFSHGCAIRSGIRFIHASNYNAPFTQKYFIFRSLD